MTPAEVMKLPAASKRTRYKQPLRGPRYRSQRYVVHAKDFMSTSTINTAGALTPFCIVARAAGLETWALQKLLPDGFLGNQSFVDNSEAVTQLTPAGIAELARAVERRGYAVMAHSLRVLARERAETPSRALIPPAPKDAPVQHHAWQDRADING